MKQVISTLSLLSLTSALAAIIFLLNGRLTIAFLSLFVALAFDMIDGPIARKYGVASKQGAIFDMLTDVPLHLIFPALLLHAFGVSIWLLGLFVLAGIFRLVRFTLRGHLDKGDKLYYQGVPVYYSHFLILLYLLFPLPSLLLDFLLVILGLLMVSLVPTYKLKPQYLGGLIILYIAVALWKLS